MSNVICRDTYGNPLEFLAQWDQNVVMVVSGISMTYSPRVRFSNKNSKFSKIVRPSVSGEDLYVDIPNYLLQQEETIIVDIFYEYNGSILTKYVFAIPVIPRPRPEDYTMSDNIDYIDWLEFQEQIEDLLEEMETEREDDVLIVSESEPELLDVLWFDTSEQ